MRLAIGYILEHLPAGTATASSCSRHSTAPDVLVLLFNTDLYKAHRDHQHSSDKSRTVLSRVSIVTREKRLLLGRATPPPASSNGLFLALDGYARWYGSAARAQASAGDDASRGTN